MDHNGLAIDKLKYDVEQKLGRTFKSPVDFDYLSRKIKESSNEDISTSTLMRLWKYVHTKSQPRKSTLSVLCRYLGYPDWETYCAMLLRNRMSDSDFLTSKYIRSCDLALGDIIEVEWNPDRRMRMAYRGDNHFVVVEVENSRLHINDTFAAVSFCLNSPLYIHDLVHDGEKLPGYVAGKESGIISLVLIPAING